MAIREARCSCCGSLITEPESVESTMAKNEMAEAGYEEAKSMSVASRVASRVAKNKMAEARYEEARIVVFWVMKDCPIPRGCKAEGIVPKLSSALKKLNYRGEISITAYANLNHVSPSLNQTLASSGIVLEHVDSRMILTLAGDLYLCGLSHQAPANVMLIAGEESYDDLTLRTLDSWGFNILLAHPPNPPASLLMSAKTTWPWRSLLEEEEAETKTCPES